ncbi:retinoid-inducible serine carboxypeptidase [Megalopta genalis]|uniref:retinoid-inducible serine carboxypeptidase n=1 Tax=Megalopta genalis TaxID=115081 RepID=UPI003FCF20B9
MSGSSVLLLVAICLASGAHAKIGFGPGEQEWGYVKVRSDANMFWWLYYTTANVSSYYDKPLIIWLQGGPGASSTSYGNFEELGPLDLSLNQRNHTWVKDYNVLFIDNPVGTGFSYVTDPSAYTTTNEQIASDLVECMRGFLKVLPKFANVSTYITTESYGGKMGVDFALAWYKAQQAGTIKSNLKGVSLIDSWIDPIGSVMEWAPFLYATGMVDTEGYKTIDKAAQATKNAVNAELWFQATSLWSAAERVILQTTSNIDFYNILTKKQPGFMRDSSAVRYSSEPALMRGDLISTYDFDLNYLMNGPVKRSLNLTVEHSTQSDTVFYKLQEDFMKPVVDKVELLLNQTNLKVDVITGQLDLIVDTPGTVNWVENMKWKYSNIWLKARRQPLVVQDVIEGYVKSYGNLAMYWVNRAGHMVPKDNPAAMAQILKRFAN